MAKIILPIANYKQYCDLR